LNGHTSCVAEVRHEEMGGKKKRGTEILGKCFIQMSLTLGFKLCLSLKGTRVGEEKKKPPGKEPWLSQFERGKGTQDLNRGG